MNNRSPVEIINPLTDPRWAQLSLAHHGGLFHSVPWMSAVAGAYGFPIQAAIALEQGRPAAGLAFCHLTDCAGSRIVSLPFTDACDPLGSSPAAIGQLIAHLQSYGVPIQLRALDSEVAKASGLPIGKRARWHRLPIADPGSMWQSLSPSMRRGVRKAERDGVTVEPLSSEDATQQFLHLHAGVRKHKYHLLAQPQQFFEALRAQFSPSGDWLPLAAFHHGRPIAATIYLRCGNVLYYKFNASALDSLAPRPNNLLLWEGAKLAHRLGCHTLDLGPSDDAQPGLIRFKQQSGATQSELQFLRWTPDGWHDPNGAELRGLLGQLTALLAAPEVPDEISIRAGALLYRYFA